MGQRNRLIEYLYCSSPLAYLVCQIGLCHIVYLRIICIAPFYKRKLDLESSLEVERKQSLNKQELNEERLRFYTNITHELRTPLTLILGPLEDLLSDATLSPKHANKSASFMIAPPVC